MSSKRQTQHRKERDAATGKELSDLKRENNQLKRKISKLQKQLQRAVDGLQYDEDEVDVPKGKIEAVVEVKPTCLKCGGLEFAILKTTNGHSHICKKCFNKVYVANK